MSNLIWFPNPNDDLDLMWQQDIELGFAEIEFDKKGRPICLMTEKGKREAYDYYLQACLRDQEEARSTPANDC